jgi:multicomponent Na+:H+ antiporter subunit E
VLIVANLQIAWEILTPRHNVSPRIVRFDVAGMTPLQRAVMVNLINLTPGTLVVGISRDETTFYVHCMYASDRTAAINDLIYLKTRLLTEVF